MVTFSTTLQKQYCTSKSLWVNIHPLQRVVIFHFESHFDLIGAVSLRAERREKTYGRSPNTTLHSHLQDSSLKRTTDHCFYLHFLFCSRLHLLLDFVLLFFLFPPLWSSVSTMISLKCMLLIFLVYFEPWNTGFGIKIHMKSYNNLIKSLISISLTDRLPVAAANPLAITGCALQGCRDMAANHQFITDK